MANVDAPFGLRPIGNRVGVANFQTTEYQIKDNVDNDMFQGDPLEIDTGNAGYVFGIAAVDNPNSIGALSGVMISKDPSTGKPKFSNYYTQTNVATGETIKAFVYDNPFQTFLIQGDTDTAAAQTDVGKTGKFIETHAGKTSTGLSGAELDVSENAATGEPLAILGFTTDPDNNEMAIHANYVVTWNEHALKDNQ